MGFYGIKVHIHSNNTPATEIDSPETVYVVNKMDIKLADEITFYSESLL